MGLIEYRAEDQIGFLTINNPSTLNALDFPLLEELEKLLDTLQDACIKRKSKICCLIITGAGEKAFIAGGDITVQNTFDTVLAYNWACTGQRVLKKIEELEVPVIAAVNGYALGGGTEVVLACDLVVASEKAVFGQPEVGLGITPGFGGTQRLPRKVGLNIAKEWILTGRRIMPEEAKQAGLVNRIAAHDKLMEETMKLAQEIISNGTHAVRMAKQAINDGIQCDLDRGLSMERALFSTCFSTMDQNERMEAFLNRKK
ncbi:MAG: enoyl-CoA hydratase/isomerase family protein [Lachnospiraceae bacterium]|nr:enoyl-CoA hydratase/isomerase family protein [Lachnospiraceae bacterium]